jgi:hypothetical protein
MAFDTAKHPVLVCFGSPRRLYVELYIENLGADAFPCASMLGSVRCKILLNGKTHFLDGKFIRLPSL